MEKKNINQLLELSKNPYYKFTQDERDILDDFLLRERGDRSKKSQKKDSDKSSKKTPVIVRNIVKKADTYPPELHEPMRDEFKRQ